MTEALPRLGDVGGVDVGARTAEKIAVNNHQMHLITNFCVQVVKVVSITMHLKVRSTSYDNTLILGKLGIWERDCGGGKKFFFEHATICESVIAFNYNY